MAKKHKRKTPRPAPVTVPVSTISISLEPGAPTPEFLKTMIVKAQKGDPQ